MPTRQHDGLYVTQISLAPPLYHGSGLRNKPSGTLRVSVGDNQATPPIRRATSSEREPCHIAQIYFVYATIRI